MTITSNIDPDKKLTPKQERFCILYASDVKFFGNGTQAYIEAYQVDISVFGAYVMARSAASENLTKPHIMRRINELLHDIGFDDVSVDKQLAFVVMQHGDLKAKIAAIKEYNSLKKRVSQRLELVGFNKTRDKIKEFLDESTDADDTESGAESDAAGTEPAGPVVGPSPAQVAPTPPAI